MKYYLTILFVCLSLAVAIPCYFIHNSGHPLNIPYKIGEMPDGRVLNCIEVDNPDASHIHFVYFFSDKDTNTVTTNYSVSNGKTTRNECLIYAH